MSNLMWRQSIIELPPVNQTLGMGIEGKQREGWKRRQYTKIKYIKYKERGTLQSDSHDTSEVHFNRKLNTHLVIQRARHTTERGTLPLGRWDWRFKTRSILRICPTTTSTMCLCFSTIHHLPPGLKQLVALLHTPVRLIDVRYSTPHVDHLTHTRGYLFLRTLSERSIL